MHRFVLVAPLWSDHTNQPAKSTRGTQTEQVLLTSRRGFSTRLLTQEWMSFEPPALKGWDVLKVAIVTIGAARVGVVDARVESSGLAVHQLESRLTEGATKILATAPGQTSNMPRWVNRTLIDTTEIPDWISDSVGPAMSFTEGTVTATMSWGNNQAFGFSGVEDDEWRDFVRGLVDAQVLWTQLDKLVRDGGAELSHLVGSPEAAAPRAFAHSVVLEREFIAHDLAMDEFNTQVQGIRRRTAEHLLRSWGMTTMRDRAERRVRALAQVSSREIERRGRRYQSTVELILLVLGLTALLQTALAVVQTAYSGGVSLIPGGEGGLLEWFRRTNVDILLSASMVLLIAILAIVLHWKRRLSRVGT